MGRKLLAAGIALAALAAVPVHAQTGETKAPATAESPLKAYTARYEASFRGITGGQIEYSVHPGTVPNQWVFESRPFPNLLGSLFISQNARQRATMEVSASGVRPLSFVIDDGTDNTVKDASATFDWAAGRVHGQAKGKTIDLAISPGIQDVASVQVAMMDALLRGQEPTGFTILDGLKLAQYRYWPEGHATVVTPYGQLDTIVWASQKPGSNRLNRIWHAPQLGYIPVQFIQYNKGQPGAQLKLVSLQR